jgi:hypothetical protein
MSDDEDIAALVVDNGSGMCKGKIKLAFELDSRGFDCRLICIVIVALYHTILHVLNLAYVDGLFRKLCFPF